MLKQNLEVYHSVGGKICIAAAANTGHRLLSGRIDGFSREMIRYLSYGETIWKSYGIAAQLNLLFIEFKINNPNYMRIFCK